VGTSLKIPGTKRIVRETINAVHHTPRGKAIWVNLDPPPSKDFDIWIKGDCQRIPQIYGDHERTCEWEKVLKTAEIRRRAEEKTRAGEERLAKRELEALRKEENRRAREQRKEQKELEKVKRKQRELERMMQKGEKSAEKERRKFERAIRPIKNIVKERKWSRPLTPAFSYDTESTLSSPSLSDMEFASFVESESRMSLPTTPPKGRVIEYLPTPTPTPQKHAHSGSEIDSPFLNKKRRQTCLKTGDGKSNNSEVYGECTNSMSIRFLTDSD
jgi:hypothetical protein